jgi:asparagine N-glycosylation enzyme membrane subunit Stt3
VDRTARLKFAGLWLLIGLIAAGVCSLTWPAAHLGDEYVPYANDSFYHARRILDTVEDPASFYQFDTRIHAPEGSLLTWPWAYDYAMAWLVRAGLALGVSDSPIGILIWLPVLAVFVSMGLMLLLARRLGLAAPYIVIAGLAAALSPLTQYLHSVGQIDHHYAEYIFVLATLTCGLRWLQRPDDGRAAIIVGAVLGAAPGINNGLFILQLPVLATLLVLWLQNIRMPMRTALRFAGGLLVTTLAIVIPSLPFRLGLFEYYTLSAYHLYVAACTAAVVITVAGVERNTRNIAVLVGAGIVLLLPLAHQIVMARGFLAGMTQRLDAIMEMRPLPPMLLTSAGRASLARMYSLLVFLVPATTIYCAWRGWRERATPRLLFWIGCLFGLTLMLTQVRLQYFGSFAIYLPLLLLAEACSVRWEHRHKLVVLSTALLFLLAYWMPVRHTLIAPLPIGGDPTFRAMRPILEDLRKACAEDPGIVLADNDAGHLIRYYTECSVIANNFLLTPQHEQKVRQIDYLTSVPANAFPGAAPFVRYILVRPVNVVRARHETRYTSFSQREAPLISDLLLKPLDEVPSNYVLIEQANISMSNLEGAVPYIRLFKMDPVARCCPSAVVSASSQNPVAE